jgi:transcriptional regulator with XRE-family HTH domain
MRAFDGERLLMRRVALGLSLRELATELGVSAAALSFWERGLKTPNRKNAELLEALLGSSPTNGGRRDALGA